MPIIPKKADKAIEANAPAATTKVAPVLPKATHEAPEPGPAAETAAAAAETPAVEAAPAGLPTVRASGAVTVSGKVENVFKSMFKDAFRVDWNTLARVMANNGNFLDVEAGKQAIGPELTLEIMSYQDNWQYSPGTDDDDDIQYVRYSDDGITFSTGEDVREYMAAMEAANYKEGKLAQRVVIAGNVVGGKLDGKLVQLNLSPTSKAQFDRFQMQTSIDVAKGKRTKEELGVLKMTCVVETKGKNSWTKVLFDYATPAAK